MKTDKKLAELCGLKYETRSGKIVIVGCDGADYDVDMYCIWNPSEDMNQLMMIRKAVIEKEKIISISYIEDNDIWYIELNNKKFEVTRGTGKTPEEAEYNAYCNYVNK